MTRRRSSARPGSSRPGSTRAAVLGGLMGLMIGAVVGVGGGLALGHVIFNPCPPSGCHSDEGAGAGLFFAGGGLLVGAVLGAVIGALVGWRQTPPEGR